MDLTLARRIQAIDSDWSDRRAELDIAVLARDLDSEARAEVETEIRSSDRAVNRYSGELKPVICSDMGPRVTLALPCTSDPESERKAVRELRIAQSSRDMARLANREARDSWQREHYTVMGPAKSYLPEMDKEEQLKASNALGCNRNHKPITLESLANAGHTAVVCTNGTVKHAPRKPNRRSTRGRGKRCK